ncbi:MAG: Protein of unknown function DUF664 [uncultured Thermomicrobiales bacterium]|uniref:Mini-circle protein n=1 Tax=uncultured Thermomicrobiales bacterium TaxID=1645740 RepID=A0A6J4UG69_9BACT|nr:MAG: Protein of unknown function DUF664 [uncultured Thermomicrobiales bacterium]
MLQDCPREQPPVAGPEKPMLTAFLDWQRATLLCKIDGVDDAALRRPGTASGVSLLGMVKHLADVERSWFREEFAGEDLAHVWDPNDPDAYWRIDPNETTADVVAFYQGEVTRARRIVEAADLDDVGRGPRAKQEGYTLRWILLHMVEETARHVGHADILREAIDGKTGE